ncbi:MAG: hypothetical protein JSU73_14290 [candidate division WOR-3 bacterium]|nr:MAG: hypothetical protein JSU73_14290 [candidate division WOR-3 bacterium]
MSTSALLAVLCCTFLPDNVVSRFRQPEAHALVWGLDIRSLSASWHPGAKGRDALRFLLYGRTGPWVEYRYSGENLDLQLDGTLEVEGKPFSHGSRPGYEFGVGFWTNIAANWYPVPPIPLGLRCYLYSRAEWNTTHDDPIAPYDYAEEGETIPAKTYSALQTATTLVPGLSIGRLRDATPVILALRVEEVLRDEGLLDGRLNEADLQQLARVIDRQWLPKFVHDHGRHERWWFDELETRVRALGPGRAPIPARAWLRIREALVLNWYSSLGEGYGLHNVPRRTVGLRLVPKVTFRYNSGWRKHTLGDTSWSEFFTHDTIVSPGLELDAGWPLTTRLHLLADLDYHPMDEHWQSARLRASTLLGERYHGMLTLYQSAHWDPKFERRPWGVNADADLDWFLEDRLVLSIGGRASARRYVSGHGSQFVTDLSVSGKVTYRLN